MLARNQRPRTVFVPLLRGHLNVGDFVHVKEVQGRDAGEHKVYRILRFSADSPEFESKKAPKTATSTEAATKKVIITADLVVFKRARIMLH